MKRFSSYGPPKPKSNFMVQRPALIEQIAGQLEGTADEGGHYFTIFAPRQVGKTTIMRQVVTHLRARLGDSVWVGMATLHLIRDLRSGAREIFDSAFGLAIEPPNDWEACKALFHRNGPLKKPAILILDEFDGLERTGLNEAVELFRQIYLQRDQYLLHGLALIGVHAVLGELTRSMSPFNVQRSVNVPSLTRNEVIDLYGQYTAESGQPIEAEGVERIYDMFRGQPGLTCWFGELLTEKRNLVQPPPWARQEGPPPEGYPLITRRQVDRVMTKALSSEININIRNLISKGMQHQELLCELFVSHDVLFDLNEQNIQWLYLNGILVGEADSEDSDQEYCAFASPFVQRCLFSAFGRDLNRAYKKALLYDSDEPIALGNAVKDLDVPSLVALYRRFLSRQQAKGESPWSDQPSRTDARAFEAIGHFNLYAWLYGAAKGGFSIVPEFPTGNGTADLLLKTRAQDRQEVLEIKSFTNTSDLEKAVEQAARYAKKLTLPRSFLVVMADVSAYEMLRSAPTQHEALGITVTLEVIPWGFVPGGGPGVNSVVGQKNVVRLDAHLSDIRALQPVGLSSSDRLALERLVMPLLTVETLELVWNRLALDGEPPQQGSAAVGWTRLVKQLSIQGRLVELPEVLRFTFPEVATDPLLTKLETLG